MLWVRRLPDCRLNRRKCMEELLVAGRVLSYLVLAPLSKPSNA